MRRPGLWRRRGSARGGARIDRQDGLTRARRRTNLQFGCGGSANVNPDISESEIQSTGLWNQDHRTGRRCHRAVKAPATILLSLFLSTLLEGGVIRRQDRLQATAGARYAGLI